MLDTSARMAPLRHYLKLQHPRHTVLTLGFRQIEGIIGDGLPKLARKDPDWWANVASVEQAQSWLDAGWRVQTVDLPGEQVTLVHTSAP